MTASEKMQSQVGLPLVFHQRDGGGPGNGTSNLAPVHRSTPGSGGRSSSVGPASQPVSAYSAYYGSTGYLAARQAMEYR